MINVIVVDDSRVTLLMMKSMILEREPEWNLITANTADDALEILAGAPGEVFYLTIDFNMPDINGLELGKKVHEKYPSSKSVLLTANTLDSVRDEAKQYDMVTFLKPIKGYIVDNIIDIFKAHMERQDAIPDGIQNESQKPKPKLEDDTNSLTEEEVDLLKETFSIGMHTAAGNLTRMISKDVLISIPYLTMEKSDHFPIKLKEMGAFVAITAEMTTPFDAKAILLFNREGGGEMIKQMVGDYLDDEMMESLYEDALIEIGNIILTPCMVSISKMYDSKLGTSFPHFHLVNQTFIDDLVSGSPDDVILNVSVKINIKDVGIDGMLTFLLGPVGLDAIKKPIRHFIDDLQKNNYS